jgi:hypothetical protein
MLGAPLAEAMAAVLAEAVRVARRSKAREEVVAESPQAR